MKNLSDSVYATENKSKGGSIKLSCNKMKSKVSLDMETRADKLFKKLRTRCGVHWVSHKMSWNFGQFLCTGHALALQLTLSKCGVHTQNHKNKLFLDYCSLSGIL